MMDEVRAFVDRVARVVPQVQYVGWDIVVTPDRPGARRGQLGCRRVREQAERHRHPHRAQGPLPRGHRRSERRELRASSAHRSLTVGQASESVRLFALSKGGLRPARTMPSGVDWWPWPSGLSLRIATSRFSPALSSVEPRMLPPRSLMSTTATSAVPPSSAFRCARDLARALGTEHDRLVVRRDRAAGRAVDRAGLVAGDAVEVALAAERAS